MKMVTPRVKQYAGQHFNCPSINGVEIEDQVLDAKRWNSEESREKFRRDCSYAT